MFLKNRNIISKIKRSKVTDYAALSRYQKLVLSPPVNFLLAIPRRCSFCGSFCHLLGKGQPLGSLCVMFSCVFVTFPCSFLGQVWYWIVLIPELCLPSSYQLSLCTLVIHINCCKGFFLLIAFGHVSQN